MWLSGLAQQGHGKGAGRREIEHQVAEDFPYLPPGCAVSLGRISRDQSTTTASSPTALRYVGHDADGGHVLLFVRETKRSPKGNAQPYLFAGPIRYRSHQGDRPMGITWELETELPPDFFAAARRLPEGRIGQV